ALVGADVAGGALATDVLLARRECEHEPALTVLVHGFAADAPRQLLQVLSVVAPGEHADAAASLIRRAGERLAFAHCDVRPQRTWRLRERQRVRLSVDRDQKRPPVVARRRQAIQRR